MAEGRMIKKRIATSKKIAAVGDSAALLYFMMYPHSDVQGRVEGCPDLIKGQMLTYFKAWNGSKIQKCLRDLQKIGLILLYNVEGNQYIQFTRFEDFQTLNPDREAKSIIPEPTPDNSGVDPEESPLSKVKLSKDKVKLRVKFTKPSVDDIKNYCLERKNGIDPQRFFDSNESKGWVVGKTQTPMKDWKAAIRTWEGFNKDKQSAVVTRGHQEYQDEEWRK